MENIDKIFFDKISYEYQNVINTMIFVLIPSPQARFISYHISQSHYFFHHPKQCRKLSKPGDLDNSERKLI